MNSKFLNISIFMGLILLSILSLNAIKDFPNPAGNNTLDSGYYPRILVTLLIIFSLFGIFKEFFKKSTIFKVENIKPIALSLLLIVGYFLTWHYIGYFYFITFIFLVLCINYYDFIVIKKIYLKGLFINSIISLGVVVFIYLLFDKVLSITF